MHDDRQPGDEMVLVGFHEEPAVFDEDPEYEDDEDEDDEADEILDIYEDEEEEDEERIDEAEDIIDVYESEMPDDEQETAYGDDRVSDEDGVVPDEHEELVVDDEMQTEIGPFGDEGLDDEQAFDADRSVIEENRDFADEGAEVLDENRPESGNWIFDAFEVWTVTAVEDHVVNEDERLDAFDEEEGDADEFTDEFDEPTEDSVEVPASPHEGSEVSVAVVVPTVGHNEPYDVAPPLSSETSVKAGRKKARHRKQSARQRKRSVRRTDQDAMRAERSSKKAAAKASKQTLLPSPSKTDLRADPRSVLFGLSSR
jgi:hypothetical protein